MPVSASSASLNRFPGLDLKAWALFNGTTIVKSYNVASITKSGTGLYGVTLSTSAGSNYCVDFGGGGAKTWYAQYSSGNYFVVHASDFGGTPMDLGISGFVAVYG